MALAPELTILITAFFILLIGLKKTFNSNSYLSMASLVGIVIALIFSISLWGNAPNAGNGADPGMFSKHLIHDRFSQSFNIIFLVMSLITIFGSVKYTQSDHENKAEYFTLVLMAVAFVRELLGTGKVFGYTVLQPVTEGGWYVPNGLMVLSPAAFFLIGCFIWAVRSWKTDQVEEEFHVGALLEPGHEGHIR